MITFQENGGDKPWFDEAKLTKFQSMLLIFSISVFENMPKRLTETLLQLISWHLPPHVTYPKTVYQLHKDLGLTYGNFTTFYVCLTPNCSGLICDKDMFQKPNQGKAKFGTCGVCQESYELLQLSRTNSMFVIFDLAHQLESLLSDPAIAKELHQGIFNITW